VNKGLLGALIGLLFYCCQAPLWCQHSTNILKASQKLPPQLVEVYADRPWNETSILVQQGDLLIIRYVSGSWSPWSGGAYDAIGFGGNPNCDCNVMKGISHAALIGKIGEGSPFFIGENFHHRMGEAGILYLGINDTRTTDNSGFLLVQVEVWR